MKDKFKNLSDMQKLSIFAAGFVVLLLLIVALLMSSITRETENADKTGGQLGGLLNGDALFDPDPVTKEDLEEEYQSRTEMTPQTQAMLEGSVLTYLSRGDFSGLDELLAEQEALYRNAEGDDAQAMEDWQARFAMYRSDIVATQNLTEDNAKIVFQQYTCPEVLAAAIAYSPASVKMDAFLDYSSAILPAVPDNQKDAVSLEPVTLENAGEMMQSINEYTAVKYIDLVAYDMTLYGYRCRRMILGDEYGYYRPYTLQNIDGHCLDGFKTKADLLEMKQYLDLYNTLDDVYSSISPFNQSEYDQFVKEHPDWFAEDGSYIGAPEEASAGTASSEEDSEVEESD